MDDLFPYETVRPSQDDMKGKVEEALQDQDNLIAHAPTGLGKTAATVPPALAYALSNDKTVFFVTPRHSQHEIAVETLKEIKEEHGTSFVAVDLIGKQWLCEGEQGANIYLEGEESNCPRHDDTYTDQHQLTDRAKQKQREIKREILRAEEVKERCEKVCPYDILMHTAAEADIVIGDYFHVFHSGVRDALFSKSSLSLQDCIIIVDEAHNLAGRTRNLNSARLNEKMLKNAATEASKYGFYSEEQRAQKLRQELQRLAQNELGMEREAEIAEQDFTQRVTNIRDYDDLKADFEAVAKDVQDDGEDSECGAVANFLDRWTGTDHGFTRVLKKVQRSSGETYISLAYKCLDPQYTTKEVIRQSHTTVAMSGTLTPLHMYQNILGFPDDTTHTEKYRSPFPEENKLSLVVDQVTTKYKERDEEMYKKIAWYIKKSAEHISGNIGVFFPSYSLRNDVKDHLDGRIDQELFLEDRRMDKEDKREFLDRFAKKSGDGAVLLGVVGGSFGEGVDFPGDLMEAVFVVGLPLQKPDLETQALIDFYDETFGRGWDYGYNFPAVNRALQAAGRCIRSSEDRGVVVYMDERYKWSKYRNAMPEDDYRLTKAPWNDIRAFFGN